MRTKLLALCFLLAISLSFKTDCIRTSTNSSGMSVAVWLEKVGCTYEVFAQRQDADGNPTGPTILVNEDQGFDHLDGYVAIDDAENFVVVWERIETFKDSYEVYLRRYDFNDNPSDIFRITYTDGYSGASAVGVTMTPSGKFAVCWAEFDLVPMDNFSLWLQQFAPDCSPLYQPVALTEGVPRYKKSSVAADLFCGLNCNEQEITIQFRRSLYQPVVTETLFWADIKPTVTLQYQQEENPGDFVVLTVSPAIASKKYAVYCCDDLSSNIWLPLGEPVIAESNSLTVIDTGGATSSPLRETKSRFYKVCLVP